MASFFTTSDQRERVERPFRPVGRRWRVSPLLRTLSLKRSAAVGLLMSNLSYTRMRAIDDLTYTGLASNGVLSEALGDVPTGDGRITSVDGIWTIENPATGEGPLLFGVCHADYLNSEIKECIESQNAGQADRVARERANRLVREIGVFPDQGELIQFNDGRTVKIRLNWPVTAGLTPLKMWIYNLGTGGITGSPLLHFVGKLNLFLDG